MSKTIIYSLISLLVVAGGIYYFSRSSPQVDTGIQTITEAPDTILLFPESGEVLYKTPDDKNFQKATATPTTIPNLTVVHTGEGKATVLFSDNSNISLDKNTEITIDHTKSSVNIFQSIGTTYHRVEKLISGATYEVKTPGTLAAVRGTKFVVKYYAVTGSTKVSVIENKVEVKGTNGKGVVVAGTTTEETATSSTESVFVAESQTVTVESPKDNKRETPQIIRLQKTENDPSIKEWIDTNKARDAQFDSIKAESNNKEDLRKELIRGIVDVKKVNVKVDEVKPKVVVKEVVKPIIVATNTPALTDEQFDTVFGDMFIKYFYIDDSDTPCTTGLTPAEKVRRVTDLATKNKRVITKTTLLSFGQAIDTYCARKDPVTKTTLQGRFDIEYPF